MKINKKKCVGCEACHPYCPVGAITTVKWKGELVSEVNQGNCVECGVCLRSGVCSPEAIYMPKLEWPRSLRAEFSDPSVPHSSTKIPGRGTFEMKNNDITGRFRRGFAGVVVELGRPGVGTTFRDTQTICMTLAEMGIELEPANPVASLIVDKKVGKINEKILDGKVLSVIIEFTVENGRLKEVLEKLKTASNKIRTVFSLGLISRVSEDGMIPVVPIAKEVGFSPSPNTKTNVGLGRPLRGEVKDDTYIAPERGH